MDTTVVRGDAPPAAVHTLEDFKRNFGLLEAALSKGAPARACVACGDVLLAGHGDVRRSLWKDRGYAAGFSYWCGSVADTVDPHADIAKLWSWVDWIRARHGSQEHNNFFFATALPRLARTLLKRRYVCGEGGVRT